MMSAAATRLPGQRSLGLADGAPSITAPIASATTVEQLDELIAATRLRLDMGDIEQLNAASA